MKRTLLYYPTFNFPSQQWLKDSLLYWDEVGSIVPERFLDRNSRAQRYLADEGIYRRFDPEEALGDYIVSEELTRELEDRLQSADFLRELAKPSASEYWEIAFEKLGYPAYQVLKDRKLAEPNFSARQWCRVRKPAAILYMGLLARCLASRAPNFVQPSTDHAEYEDMIYQSRREGQSTPGLALSLKNTLPRVSPDTELSKLIKFRFDHRDELLRFRTLIDETQQRLVTSESPDEAKLLLTQFKEQYELNVNSIRRLTEEQGIRTWVGSLRAIFNCKSPALVGLLAGGLSGTAISANPLVTLLSGAAGLGAGAAIELAAYSLDTRDKKKQLREQPLSYLYSAQQEGIV